MRNILMLQCSAAAMLCLPSAFAQGEAESATQARARGFDEIVVTAQRREENIADAPIAVSAIGDDDLRDRAVRQISDVAKFVPNVEINNGRTDAAGSQAAIFIRGVGQSDFLFPNDPGVGLYLDGVYLSRSVGTNLELADIERLEVLRGPQGTLYGKNTIGGAINVVTKAPNLTETEGELTVIAGNYERRDVTGYIAGPIVEGLLGYKISGISRNQEGFMVRGDGTDLGDINRDGLRASLLYTPTPRLEVRLDGDITTQRQNGQPGFLANVIPSENFVPAPVPDLTPSTPLDLVDFYNLIAAPVAAGMRGLPPGTRFDSRFVTGSRFENDGTGPVRNDADIWGLGLTVDWELSDNANLKSITAYREVQANFSRDADHSPFQIVQTDNRQTQDQLSQELQLTLDLMEGRLSWISGVFYLQEDASDRNRVSLLSPITQVTNGGINLEWIPQQSIDVLTLAAFTQATFAVTDRVNLTLGGRFSYDDKELTQEHVLADFPFTDQFGNTTFCYTCEADGVTPRVLQQDFSEFTPRVAIDYTTARGDLLYASYARGFKSGGWSPRPTPTNPTELPFDPETIDTFELGYKADFFDRRLLLSTAAFYSLYQDIQLTTLQPNFLLEVTNAAENEIMGVEIEAAARPVENLDITFSLGYLHNEYTELDTQDLQLTTDDVLPNAPELVSSIGAAYTAELSPRLSATLRADAAYRSKTWFDPFNLRRDEVLQFVGGAPTFVPIPSGTDGYLVQYDELAQDAYWLLNARLSFLDSETGFELAFFGTNLLDEEYVNTILPVTAFGFDEGVYGRPREYGVSARYSF